MEAKAVMTRDNSVCLFLPSFKLVGQNDVLRWLKTLWLIPSLTSVLSIHIHITFSLLYTFSFFILMIPSINIYLYFLLFQFFFHKHYSNISLLNLWPSFFTPNLFEMSDFVSPHTWPRFQSDSSKEDLNKT